MNPIRVLIVLVLLLLSVTPVFAVNESEKSQPVEGEIVTEEDAPPGNDVGLDLPETDEVPQETEENSELPEGLELDSGGNVEESESIYSVNLNLPQDLIGSEVTIQDPLGTNLKQMTVGPTGQVSYNFMTPQSLNVTVQGAITGEEDDKEGMMPIATAVVIGLFASMIVALLSFLGGRMSALHVLNDLRDYIYDKNLD